jgi:hypothetical protein
MEVVEVVHPVEETSIAEKLIPLINCGIKGGDFQIMKP